MEVHINTNYPTSLDEMTEEHLEEEHLILFLNSVGLWLASNQFMTRLHDWLGVKTKMEYYDGMKFVLKEKFPRHTYFHPTLLTEWAADLRKKFKTHATRSRMEDDGVVTERKSEPLYRDLATNRDAVRAKYLGE